MIKLNYCKSVAICTFYTRVVRIVEKLKVDFSTPPFCIMYRNVDGLSGYQSKARTGVYRGNPASNDTETTICRQILTLLPLVSSTLHSRTRIYLTEGQGTRLPLSSLHSIVVRPSLGPFRYETISSLPHKLPKVVSSPLG